MQYMLDFMKNMAKNNFFTEPLAHVTLLGFNAAMGSLICTLAEAYMIGYLRLLVVDTHFPVYIPKKYLMNFPTSAFQKIEIATFEWETCCLAFRCANHLAIVPTLWKVVDILSLMIEWRQLICILHSVLPST